jgi:hypothetical protein
VTAARPAGHERLHLAAAGAAEILGVYSALREPLSLPDLAERLGVARRHLERLVDVLVLGGSLLRANGRLQTSPAVRPLPPPLPLGARTLAAVVRRGTPVGPDDGLSWQVDVSYLAATRVVDEGPETVREVAARLAPALGAGRLLDAGGGLGAYALALVDLCPGAHAVVLERPRIVAAARRALGPRAAALELREGDLTLSPLGEGYQVALLNHVLHTGSPESAQSIVARVAEALAPGGLLAVKELWIAPDRTGGATGLLYALAMSLVGEEVAVDDTDRLAERLRRAGLVDIRIERLDTAPDAVVVSGRRPAA